MNDTLTMILGAVCWAFAGGLTVVITGRYVDFDEDENLLILFAFVLWPIVIVMWIATMLGKVLRYILLR